MTLSGPMLTSLPLSDPAVTRVARSLYSYKSNISRDKVT